MLGVRFLDIAPVFSSWCQLSSWNSLIRFLAWLLWLSACFSSSWLRDHDHRWWWQFCDVGKAVASLAAPTVSSLGSSTFSLDLPKTYLTPNWIILPNQFVDRPRRHCQRDQMKELCTSDCFLWILSASVMRLHSLWDISSDSWGLKMLSKYLKILTPWQKPDFCLPPLNLLCPFRTRTRVSMTATKITAVAISIG